MTDKEKRIVDKLKAIIKNTPYEGEKNTAINVLKKYCLKHNISEIDLEDEEKRYFTYVVDGKFPYEEFDEGTALFVVIARKFYERRKEDFYEQGHRGIQIQRKKYEFRLFMKNVEFVELIAEYEFYKKAYRKAYRKAFKEWEKTFFRAFLMRQDLLLNPAENEDVKKPTYKEIQREEKVMEMAEEIKKSNYYKQLESKENEQ